MFTGLVEAVGSVTRVEIQGAERDLEVDLSALPREPAIGDSIALSGCCCTVVRIERGVARFRLTAETLRRTWLGTAQPGTRLNLEDAVRAGEPLGGHLVQGHVDGIARVTRPVGSAGGEWGVAVPDDLARYCVEKGSICLDGVSLTIAALAGSELMIALIPHTATATTLGSAPLGAALHVEVDVIAKYVERMLGDAVRRSR